MTGWQCFWLCLTILLGALEIGSSLMAIANAIKGRE